MLNAYRRWLHGQWPAGTVEPLPVTGPGGATSVPGVRVAGELAGQYVIKDAAASGERAVDAITSARGFKPGTDPDQLDLVVIGAGAAATAAAKQAGQAGLSVRVFEAGLAGLDRIERKGKDLVLHHRAGEATRARNAIIAVARSGVYRKLDCPGGHLDKVRYRVVDPQELDRRQALVVGDGDAAVETAVALATCGARVTFCHREAALTGVSAANLGKLSAIRDDPSAQIHIEAPVSPYESTATMRTMKSAEGPGSIAVLPATDVARVDQATVTIVDQSKRETTIPNAAVFAMLGRESPVGFLQRSGIQLKAVHDSVALGWLALALVLCAIVLHWKGNYQELPLQQLASKYKLFPYDIPGFIGLIGGSIGEWAKTEGNLLYTLKAALGSPSFYFTAGWSLLVTVFGIRRIRRTGTPYVFRQTVTLIAVQWIFLCLLPEIVLPWIGRNGYFERNSQYRYLADHFFERLDGMRGHERAYWRAVGFIIPFPLDMRNLSALQPMWAWFWVAIVQLGAFLPLMTRRWGKGGYCGRICPWGAIAETVGDRQRDRMPHGPRWNRLNMIGQGVLAVAIVMFFLRFVGWTLGYSSWASIGFFWAYNKLPYLNYAWMADVLLAGMIGLGFTFFSSGRTFCRFVCPLGALLHVYARGMRFRIFPDKAKCVSCNACTATCHAGVDVMNFANKDLPVLDPECVRCSSCVAECPTGALTLGFRRPSGEVVLDKVPASLVQVRDARLTP